MLKISSFPGTSNSLTEGTENKTLWLFVWQAMIDGETEILFTYGPKSDVNFIQNKTNQQLKIILESPENIDPENPRFLVSHFTADRMKPITGVKHKTKSTQPVTHDRLKSKFIGEPTEAEFDMKMSPGESFYLNIIVTDQNNKDRLISCDPQVENGTGT